jgi:hypothetical protein
MNLSNIARRQSNTAQKYGLKFGCTTRDRRFTDLLILCAFPSTVIQGVAEPFRNVLLRKQRQPRNGIDKSALSRTVLA